MSRHPKIVAAILRIATQIVRHDAFAHDAALDADIVADMMADLGDDDAAVSLRSMGAIRRIEVARGHRT